MKSHASFGSFCFLCIVVIGGQGFFLPSFGWFFPCIFPFPSLFGAETFPIFFTPPSPHLPSAPSPIDIKRDAFFGLGFRCFWEIVVDLVLFPPRVSCLLTCFG
ncbi:hypothetical protein HOY82DRAFT_555119 [Tuber indicum]|nr:hypothetical protein HOY82DRAFT_555119 [Tuber indicum]